MTNWLYGVIEGWLKRKRDIEYIRDKNFRVAEEYADKGILPVEILDGPFKGTIFVVTSIDIVDSYGRAKFNHTVLVKQPGKHDSYYGNKFSEVVGNIVIICLQEAQTNYQELRKEVLASADDRTEYFEEPVEERTR